MIPQRCIRENFSKKKIGREEAEECRLSPQPTAHGPAAEHLLRPQVGRGLRPEPAHPADGPNLLKPDTNSVSLGPAWAGPLVASPLPRLAAAACGAALAPLRRSHPITDPPSSSCSIPRLVYCNSARKISSAASLRGKELKTVSNGRTLVWRRLLAIHGDFYGCCHCSGPLQPGSSSQGKAVQHQA